MNDLLRRMRLAVCVVALLCMCRTGLAITPRSVDGADNNLANPAWGRAHSPEMRLTPADYLDGMGVIRTDMNSSRPNARDVSTAIFSQAAEQRIPDENGLSEMVWAWGQFVDHDIDFTSDGVESHVINILPTDPAFARDSDQMIPMPRKSYSPRTGTSLMSPRQYPNDITTWLDASLVYGSDAERAAALRDNAGLGAKLRTHPFGNPGTDADNLLPTAQDLMDAGIGVPSMAMDTKPTMGADVRFIVGDVRANENTAILSLHTLMVREHNRIVDVLTAADPAMSDEDKYQTARKVVGAEMQAITYEEYLPAVGVHVDTTGGYDPAVDPSISVEFAHAIFRMGHVSVNEQALRLNNDLTSHPRGPVTLEATFFNPAEISRSGGIEPFLLGLISNVQEATNAKMVPGLRNGLFQVGPTSIVNDLAAIDIERGRDIGLGDYNEARVALGLPPIEQFSDITSDSELAATLSDLYGGDVDNIDLWVGMLAEDHLPGVPSGETIQQGLQDQFTRLAAADRFFYQWDPDLEVIETTYGIKPINRLAQLMLANTDIPDASIQNAQNVMFAQIPEPAAAVLLVIGAVGIAFARIRP